MNGFLLLIPFLLIRFGFLSVLNKSAVKRAAYFPPVYGKEVAAYWIYQISNAVIFLYLCFLTVKTEASWRFCISLLIYLSGLVLCAVSILDFSAPSEEGLNHNGVYRFSRNPMYVSYFICFTGCALLTRSLILYGFVFLFQVTSHWIILSEERWCIEKFGDAYRQYMKKVRRYI
ncbi:MAG: isoprenylcysteine carboxylmethyltransferase family protein [Anaerostipes sp.]|nr:isoprenylcysteine carboxylmethyltransferase family protein [Anaerostipes sp.]MBS7009626.1 isoprenylcysteine carboxylmethyltransferase family protein [Anaerostipes sp.]